MGNGCSCEGTTDNSDGTATTTSGDTTSQPTNCQKCGSDKTHCGGLHYGWWIGIALILALLIGLGIFFWYRSKKNKNMIVA